jgi:methionyl-tRNA formyltransferase
MDTGPIIGQLAGKLDPRKATATELYHEAIYLEEKLIKMFVPLLRENIAPRIPQDMTKRTVYGKIKWEEWPEEKVKRARTYPYK